jgi:hypothetical protein
MVLRTSVAVATSQFGRWLSVGVATRAGSILVVAYQCDWVARQARILEARRRVAVLADRSVVRLARRFMAVSALRPRRFAETGVLVATEALYLVVATLQCYGVRCHLHGLPLLCGLVAVVAGKGRGRIVRTKVTDVAVRHLAVKLSLPMAIQAHGHGTDHFSANRIKAMPNSTVTVTA